MVYTKNYSSSNVELLIMTDMSKFDENNIEENKNSEWIISKEYFNFTYFNEPLIKDACKEIGEKKLNLNVNLFKKQNNFSWTQSLNHNLNLLLLYENIKSKEVFKHFSINCLMYFFSSSIKYSIIC